MYIILQLMLIVLITLLYGAVVLAALMLGVAMQEEQLGRELTEQEMLEYINQMAQMEVWQRQGLWL